VVHNHFAALHHPTDIPDDHPDVLQWVAVKRDDVREIPGGYRSQALLLAE
jgi:hypothetical protein